MFQTLKPVLRSLKKYSLSVVIVFNIIIVYEPSPIAVIKTVLHSIIGFPGQNASRIGVVVVVVVRFLFLSHFLHTTNVIHTGGEPQKQLQL